ncbi:MAG TPA: serine/threonine-protein kinase [Planctomycetaceae bacterium]|nr:serine/threonine-protein kinase [Planctomycetaceae bacterium]
MSDNRLEELLDGWMSGRERGVTISVAELCAECPELMPELARRIQVVSRFEQLAEDGISETLGSQVDVDTSNLTRTPLPAPSANAHLPASIGGFKPLSLLGEGGMGAVYLAEDHQLGRRVAVKVMKPELAADPDARHRFLREARAMATIEHDNVMIIHAVGEDHGMPFLVMPVLKGETLDDRLLRENRLSVTESCRIGREIAAGLAAAHSHGLIHRDIKPSNIWLEGSTGRVRILDFGLARPERDDQKVTHSGAVLGTPAYMAPEQAAGTEATPRSDLFSLGAVLYRITTGTQPFAGPNLMATLNNLANLVPESPEKLNSEIPLELSTLINRLISKTQERRSESADAVVKSLQRIESSVLQVIPTAAPKLRRHRESDERKETDQPKPQQSPVNRQPRVLRKIVLGGLGGFLLLLAVFLYRIVTDQGTLILSIEESGQIAAMLDNGALVITDAKTGRTWKLTPNQHKTVPSGDYKLPSVDGLLLHVTDSSGAEFSTEEFRIRRGDEITVQVSVAPRVKLDSAKLDAAADPPVTIPAPAPQQSIKSVTGNVISPDGSFEVVVAADGQTIEMTERKSGVVFWARNGFDRPRVVFAPPDSNVTRVDRPTLFVLSGSGGEAELITSLDGKTGELLWSNKFPAGTVQSEVSFAGDALKLGGYSIDMLTGKSSSISAPAGAPLPPSQVPAPSTTSTGELAGTTWSVTDSHGAVYSLAFHEQGKLLYQTDRNKNGAAEWRLEGSEILMTINSGYAVLQGKIQDNIFSGTGVSQDGRTWTWKASQP